MEFETLVLRVFLRAALYFLGALIVMLAASIAHSDISHSIPAIGYGQSFAAVVVLSILISLVQMFAAVSE